MSLYQRVTALDSLCNCCADFVLLRLFLKFIIGRYLKYFEPVYPLQAMLVKIVLARTWSKAGCSSEEETCRGGGCKVWHQETCSLIKLRGSAVPPVADKSNESSSRKTSLKPRPLFKRTLSASRTSLPGRRGMYFFKKWDRLISQEFLHLVPWSQYYTSHPCLPPHITLLPS